MVSVCLVACALGHEVVVFLESHIWLYQVCVDSYTCTHSRLEHSLRRIVRLSLLARASALHIRLKRRRPGFGIGRHIDLSSG